MIKYSFISTRHKNGKIYGLTPYDTASNITNTSANKIKHKRNNQSNVHLEVNL
jgi:hypothetical protein